MWQAVLCEANLPLRQRFAQSVNPSPMFRQVASQESPAHWGIRKTAEFPASEYA